MGREMFHAVAVAVVGAAVAASLAAPSPSAAVPLTVHE